MCEIPFPPSWVQFCILDGCLVRKCHFLLRQEEMNQYSLRTIYVLGPVTAILKTQSPAIPQIKPRKKECTIPFTNEELNAQSIQGYTLRRCGAEFQPTETVCTVWATASPSLGMLWVSPQGSSTLLMFSLINMERERGYIFKTQSQSGELPGSLTSSEQHLDS